MADPTLLAKARKARFDDLPNFSGHPSEDVERFLKSIKNITKATNESANHEVLEIVRGKLIQSAGVWFDNNESKFTKWSDFEVAFRNRYFSTTLIQKKFDALKRRKQQRDEPITAYYDDILNLCREIDPAMSEQMIIQHLMSGVNSELKKELSRREAQMNTLDEFLKYAKVEQDLFDTFEKSCIQPTDPQQPYPDMNYPPRSSLTAMVDRSEQHPWHKTWKDRRSYPTTTWSSATQRNSKYGSENRSTEIPNTPVPNNTQQSNWGKRQDNHRQILANKFSKCKICNRTNHRTIDCFHKCTSGCFKCGQPDHNIRDCTMLQNFQ